MSIYLDTLKQSGDCHVAERTPDGFAVVRRSVDHARAFNDLAREALNRSGVDYVAFLRTDGHTGYDQMFIIPLE